MRRIGHRWGPVPALLLLYPRGGNWSSIAFRDARTPTPAGTLTFWNALDEHVGDFPLEVSPIEPVCE